MSNSEIILLIYILGFLGIAAILAFFADVMIDLFVRFLTGR